jgi:hypothetical protein
MHPATTYRQQATPHTGQGCGNGDRVFYSYSFDIIQFINGAWVPVLNNVQPAAGTVTFTDASPNTNAPCYQVYACGFTVTVSTVNNCVNTAPVPVVSRSRPT